MRRTWSILPLLPGLCADTAALDGARLWEMVRKPIREHRENDTGVEREQLVFLGPPWGLTAAPGVGHNAGMGGCNSNQLSALDAVGLQPHCMLRNRLFDTWDLFWHLLGFQLPTSIMRISFAGVFWGAFVINSSGYAAACAQLVGTNMVLGDARTWRASRGWAMPSTLREERDLV